MINTVLFDAGNVLVKIHPERAINSLAELFDVDLAEIDKLCYQNVHLGNFELGKISPQQFCQIFAKSLNKQIDSDAVRQACCNMFSPIEGIDNTVSILKNTGVKLAIVSNTNIWHWHHLKHHYHVVNLINHHILSYEVGLAKPDAGIYKIALDTINAKANQCLFFDDLAANVEAAKAIGIQAFQVEHHDQILDQLTTKGLLT